MIRVYKTRAELAQEVYPKHGIGCEMGVRHAVHAEQLIEATWPRELHLVDRWTGGISPKVLTRMDHPCVRKHHGEFADIMPTFPDDYFDYVYVDGDHHYENVVKDLLLALPRIKNGGILAGHDIFLSDKYAHRSDRSGVLRAVFEFVMETGMPLVAIADEPMSSWAIEVQKRHAFL